MRVGSIWLFVFFVGRDAGRAWSGYFLFKNTRAKGQVAIRRLFKGATSHLNDFLGQLALSR